MSDKSLTPTQKLAETQSRVAELETQVAAHAETVTKFNALQKEHEVLQAQSAETLTKLTDVAAKLVASQAALDVANAKSVVAEKARDEAIASIEPKASAKAQEILSSTGAPPIKSVAPNEKPLSTKTNISALKGLAKVKAVFESAQGVK